MSDFLLEIGTEEIPARFLPKAMNLLKSLTETILKQQLIAFKSIKAYATPRRLALIVNGIAEKQEDYFQKVTGPPVSAAYDKNGAPTKAAQGFAKSKGVNVESLVVEETERGRYITAYIAQEGEETVTVLEKTLPGLITSLQFPKSMRWGNSDIRFARPIHWIVAILDRKTLRFELDKLQSGQLTKGHRFLSPTNINIPNVSAYTSLLKDHFVIVEQEERKKRIVEQVEALASQLDGSVHTDPELLDTVTYLVEYPVAVIGQFDLSYLELPEPLLITVMKSHQKFFSLKDKNGKLMPYFITISNTTHNNASTVRKGAERVLRARLEDASFYYKEDRTVSIQSRIEELKKVTFHEKLGTLYEKAERIAQNAKQLATHIDPLLVQKAQKAAMLAKADLVTGVIREFPELQGYMGMTYSLKEGIDKDIALAIYEHYMPRFAGDTVPETDLGAVISLADKIDNITAFFSAGIIPTGSEDPFALRRQAIGIINILLSRHYPISIQLLTNTASETLYTKIKIDTTLAHDIVNFIVQRFETILLGQKHLFDSVKAVLTFTDEPLEIIQKRLERLTELRKDPRFPELMIAAKRAYNILSKDTEQRIVNHDLFLAKAESDLYEITIQTDKSISSSNDFNLLFNLIEPINRFFDEVLVMDNDKTIRNNRLALLQLVRAAFNRLCDFSKLVEQ